MRQQQLPNLIKTPIPSAFQLEAQMQPKVFHNVENSDDRCKLPLTL